MPDYADLEISLHGHQEENRYGIKARLRLPGSDVYIDAPGGEDLKIELDLNELERLRLRLDHDAYGEKLAEGLFGPAAIRTFLGQARAVTRLHDPPLPLRLRLHIGDSAPELHRLRWELIHDPDPAPDSVSKVLTTDQSVLFSRYLTSSAWRPVRTRPQAGIRALVVITNPSDVTERRDEDGQRLAEIKVADEWERARQALGTIPITLLCSDPALNPAGRPTLGQILAELRDGYDILYLVAHGTLPETGESARLYLEDAEGSTKVVLADDFVTRSGNTVPGLVSNLSRLEHLPRLVVLASCESAGTGEAGAEPASRDTRALAALGPRLAEIGVPAVVAMQGRVTMQTVEVLMPAFFQRLQDGGIDGAMAAARQAARVAGRQDWWMPVLFSRLESGRLFSRHGQIVGGQSEAFWTALRRNIEDGECTPFLGPGVTADLLPGASALAWALAQLYKYPLSHAHDLARVGQFVAVEDPTRLRKDLVIELKKGFRRHMNLRDEPENPDLGLAETISEENWSERILALRPDEIHHQLAKLNLPLYVTTNFDNFMTLALRSRRGEDERDKVRREAIDWRQDVVRQAGVPHSELVPPLAEDEQVVLHLFGKEPDLLSMVLTEDDYLDYLTRIHADLDYLVPTDIQLRMASTTLLFLGYELHDLSLKVIMRGLLPGMDWDGWGRKHVAVQVASPAADQASEKSVIDYFQKYFRGSQVDVYWGSAHQFVAELFNGWQP